MPNASPENVSAVIVVGGAPVAAATASGLPHARYVIAADSGLDETVRLGLTPEVVIGDMDSVTAEALTDARAGGVTILEYPRDKDATDLELALEHAHNRGHSHTILLGGFGGRMSHLLGNALAVTAAKYAPMRIEWRLLGTTLTVVRSDAPLVLHGEPGDVVSLLATGGDAAGVTTAGLRWPLVDETLAAGATRGISNELLGMGGTVTVDRGTVLVVHERADR